VERADLALRWAEEVLAGGEATAELAARVRQARAAVDTARQESRLLIEVDRIRVEQASGPDERRNPARLAAAYAKALGDYGVDPAAPEEAAARVRGSRLRSALLAALEDWWRSTLERGQGVTGEVEKRAVQEQLDQLDKVLAAADPEPSAFQVRWRAAILRRDGAALVRLANEADVQTLPAAEAVRLAGDLLAPDFVPAEGRAASERLLRAAQERYPSDFWVNHNLGFHPNLKPGEGVGYLRAALALRPDSPMVHWALAWRLQDLGDLDDAIRHLRTAVRLDPNTWVGHSRLGDALRKKGRFDEAIAEYRVQIRLLPDGDGHLRIGDVLCDKGQWDAAIAEYQEAIRIYKDFALAHNNLGYALAHKGQLDAAIAEYREAIRIYKNNPQPHSNLAHLNLGNALHDQGKLDEAVAEYRKAIALNPNDAEAHGTLGFALEKQGKLDEAVAEFRKATELAPKYAGAHYDLGDALKGQGKLDEAVAEYRKAIELAPTDAGPWQALGWALYGAGAYKDGIEAFRKSMDLQQDPKGGHSGQWFGLAAAHAQLGKKEGARKWYDQAVQWMEKNAPGDELFRRYRAEAAQALGLKE
jgi:tetratricopeptide (TPR) repeat protein